MKNKQKFHLECRNEISVYFLLVGMLLIILWLCANCSADNLHVAILLQCCGSNR